MSFDGKKILITGASGGLGSAMTRAFVAAGATVFALDNDSSKSRELMALCADQRGRAEAIHADLSDLDLVRQTVGAVLAVHEGVDILINNAAIYPSKPFEQYSDSEFANIQGVNAHAALTLAQLAVPYMKRRRYGRIINVASITFSGGWPNLLPYVTSKGALIGLTRALARELGEFGVTVNCISPGAFPTAAERVQGDQATYTRTVLEHQSIKRRGEPQDIANAMFFFASDACGFITGQTLNVDGGWVMQ
jgi:3-oxoacyl-[acyl-carrier protein] reductase